MRYAIVIERAENNYSAYVLDLPGCVATGATVQEAESQIREAIEFTSLVSAKTAFPFLNREPRRLRGRSGITTRLNRPLGGGSSRTLAASAEQHVGLQGA